MPPLKVLFLASEADPLVKVGGLGDVAGSLPPALKQLTTEKAGGSEVDVRLVIPFHSVIRNKYQDPQFLFEFEVLARDGAVLAQAYHITVNGVDTYLIAGAPIGDDATVYSPDPKVDGPKYIFFSLAALELVKKLDWRPDILHANDWHTAISVYALKLKMDADPFYKGVRSVLTVHNLPFMGAGTEAAFDDFGLPPSQHPDMPWWAKKFPLPLGLQTADRIVAVSQTYAREILTPEYGCGLETMLKMRQESITGIVNGLDQVRWDPATDRYIQVNFDASSLEKRRQNRAALAREFALDPDPSVPLLILISRMDPQKGVDLALQGLHDAIWDNWQAILLGTGDHFLEESSRNLEREYSERIRAIIRFDAALSRRMYAGGDLLLMPSRYEPCGLAQMMAMRYGCVPLARATGGLRDTILDLQDSGLEGTGFLFQEATSKAFTETLQRALSVYADQERWAGMQKRGMAQDFSWENSAVQYVTLYRELIKCLS